MSPKNSAHSTPVLRIDKALRLVAEAPGRSVDSSAGGLAKADVLNGLRLWRWRAMRGDSALRARQRCRTRSWRWR